MKARIWTRVFWIRETEPTILRINVWSIIAIAKFEVVGFQDFHFTPQGYSAVFLIAESHVAIHTFPERGKTFIEIASCNFPKFRNFNKRFIWRFKNEIIAHDP